MDAKKFTQLKRTGKKNIKHQDKWNYIHMKLMKHIVMNLFKYVLKYSVLFLKHLVT